MVRGMGKGGRRAQYDQADCHGGARGDIADADADIESDNDVVDVDG